MKDEALKLALEALDSIEWHGGGSCWVLNPDLIEAAIIDIKEALAQPEQEPVAWGNLANWCLDSDRVLITDKDEAAKYHRDVYDLTPLYTTPPQRTWVGLTDEEIVNMEAFYAPSFYDFYVAIEAKLRSKNNG